MGKINKSVFKSTLDGSNEKASKRLDEMIKELEKQKIKLISLNLMKSL